MQKLDRLVIKYILFIALVVLIVSNYEQAISYMFHFLRILSPVIVGIIMAYILNILMIKFENIWFPNKNNQWVNKTRRPLSILFAMLTISFVLFIVLGLVVPQVLVVLTTLIEAIPVAINQIQTWFTNSEQRFPELAVILDQFEVNWSQIVQDAVAFFNGVTTRIVETTLSTIGSIASIVINLFLSLIISIYILMSKEKIMSQGNRMIKAYFTKKQYDKIRYVLSVVDASFSHFITGEVLEAFILGVMVTAGMWIFRFPYATMLGALAGIMALIPMLGAWISGTIGFVLIGVQSPIQGLAFLIFIIIIQQLEGNIIYPKIVGDKIGLPGMWVLIAVTIGAGLAGIPGMLLSVPISSVIYKLLKQDVTTRERIDVMS
ncbi:AI-2E family transporter [Fundicoccus sp. Sow4_F4]|uniref:AI-2E family transporter n=1 Tax=Fundicoccus sp. Sow4_F4 TaxID=3438783 RepID=UPI003F92B864